MKRAMGSFKLLNLGGWRVKNSYESSEKNYMDIFSTLRGKPDYPDILITYTSGIWSTEKIVS